MSRTRTLTNLIADVRMRTNQESSTFVTDAEITEYLNQSLAELWSRLVLNEGQPHYRSSSAISVVAGTALYSLPADYWRVQEVTATIGGITGALHPFMPLERAALANAGPWGPISPVRYRVQGAQIEFQPASQSFSATLFYSPSQPRLVAGGDTFDGFNGYELAAIYDTCAQVMAKEESDPTFFERSRDRIYARIDALAASRDASHAERVQDVTGDMLDAFWMS